MAKRWVVRTVYLVVAAIALANGGCLALAIGGAAGGAAAGYALYQRGEWYRDYPANLDNTDAALKAALAELGLFVINEKREDDVITIDSRTGDDVKIRIQLKSVVSSIPADGATTHVSIRIGVFGDEALSTRIHEQVSLHLVAPVQVRPAPTTAASPPPVETAPPPLAK
jgi:hypothetical protein